MLQNEHNFKWGTISNNEGWVHTHDQKFSFEACFLSLKLRTKSRVMRVIYSDVHCESIPHNETVNAELSIMAGGVQSDPQNINKFASKTFYLISKTENQVKESLVRQAEGDPVCITEA